MEINEILDEYRNGNADKRMSLFLYHRGLRDAFDRIEQDDSCDIFAIRQIARPEKQRLIRSFMAQMRLHFPRLGPQTATERIKR